MAVSLGFPEKNGAIGRWIYKYRVFRFLIKWDSSRTPIDTKNGTLMMLSPRIEEGQQIPLIHEVHSDEERLLNTIDGEWFEILYHFRWENYRQFAADYYNALYDSNQLPPHTATEGGDVNPETKEERRDNV